MNRMYLYYFLFKWRIRKNISLILNYINNKILFLANLQEIGNNTRKICFNSKILKERYILPIKLLKRTFKFNLNEGKRV